MRRGEVLVGKGEQLGGDGASDDQVGRGKAVVLTDEVGHSGEGEPVKVLGQGIGAQRVVGTIEYFVVAVACQIGGLLEVGFELGAPMAYIGVEQLRGDECGGEHFGYEGEEGVGELGQEVKGDIADAGVGHTFYDDSVEVGVFGHLLCGVEGGGFAKELAGGVGLALEGLICAAGFEGDVEFDEPQRVVGEEVECVAVGQGVFLGDEGLERWGLEHWDLDF